MILIIFSLSIYKLCLFSKEFTDGFQLNTSMSYLEN